MKKIKLLLFLLFLSFLSYSQAGQINQINIISFNVKNTLPASIDEWINTPAALIMVAQKVPGSASLREPRMVVQLKSGGNVICGNNIATAKMVDPFDVRTFNTIDLTGFLTNCRELKEGYYTICAQFFNVDRVPISKEVCRDFRIETPIVDYAPPTLITPENEKKYSVSELQRPVIFRWTPLVPKPKETVTYRLKVWQLLQGQNATTASKTNTPIFTTDVKDQTQTVAPSLLANPCTAPYLCSFVWEIQALNKNGKPLGNNNGTSEAFTFNTKDDTKPVKEPANPSVVSNDATPPKNVFPDDNKKIDLADAKKEIKFSWTSVKPKPQEPVIYKLKVWQLMQGQTATAAIKNNKPFAEKSITDNTETTITNFLTGPCKPPYLCDFVWNVQALNREGKPVGPNEGNSQPTMFFISQYIIQIDSIKVFCTDKPGTYTFSYTVKNVNAGTAKLSNLAITSSTPAGASFGAYAPAIGSSINSGNSLTINGIINAAPNLSNICIGAEITDVVNTFWKASKDTCINVATCRCDACDEKNFVVKAPLPEKINWTNNSLSFNQPISISTTPPKTIKTITAELVYFEMTPQSADCLPCNKEDKLYGHFANGTNTQVWTGVPTNLNISITTPNTPCCSTLFRWCIRYKIEFTDCTVCSKVICYEKKKDGCAPTNTNPDVPTKQPFNQ